MIRRELTRDWQLGGRTIKSGTVLSLTMMITHFDETLSLEPQAFRPQRFIERSFGPHEYMPFGGGIRRCLGAAFAFYELKVALATILKTHRFGLVSPEAPCLVMNGITTRPRCGIKLRYLGERV